MSPLLAVLALSAPAAANDWPDLSTPPPFTGGGELDAAVLVGIDNYAALPDVTGAGVNIADWQAWLLGARGLRPVAISKRVDGDAIDVNIREAVLDAVSRVKPGGTLWLVYVGHGAPSDAGAEPMLVGADAQPSPNGIRSRSLLLSEVQEMLARGPQAHTVLVLDACFSGQGTDGRELVTETLAPARGVPELVAPTAMTVLSATSANQFAGLLPGAARPAFSYLLLGALRGWGDDNRDGVVTAQEAGDYAAGALNLVVSGRRQEPRVSGNVELPMALGHEPGPDLSALARAPAALSSTETELNLGGNTDFARAAAVARAKEAEARRMLEDAARARAEAEEARRQQLDQARDAIQRRARADWLQVQPLLTADAGAETASVVEAFVRQYQAASVTVDDVTESVPVPEVELAGTALAELKRRVGDEALAARGREEAEARAAAEARQREQAAAASPSRSEARVERRDSSPRVPLLVTGGLVAAAGGVGLLAASLSEAEVTANIEGGVLDFDTATSQQATINVLYGLGYTGLGLGLVLGGVGVALPVSPTGLGVAVTGAW